MNKILGLIKGYKKSFIFGAILVALLAFFILLGGESKLATYTVTRADILESVVLSGKITTSDQADLGFAVSGRVNKVFIKNNQRVGRGQILAQLEIGDLLADLQIVEARARQEDKKVENALRALVSEGLEVVANNESNELTPPEVSGIYDGPEGTYKIIITKETLHATNFLVRTFDLEKTEVTSNENRATPLGTKGLYISFPDNDLTDYLETVWYLEIPNKSSSDYLSNYNAYLAAKENRELVVDRAEVDKINAEIRKNTIYAPFSGIVSNIEREVGENASIGERVISILGEKKLEVVLQVSELDVSRLEPGAIIQISIDAIPGETFQGTLKTVNSRETEIEGVPVYEAFVELPLDPRIKAGMNAKGRVILGERLGVLAIPLYAIEIIDGKKFVSISDGAGETVKREVILGLEGTDSMAEVISGLNDGEIVIFTPLQK